MRELAETMGALLRAESQDDAEAFFEIVRKNSQVLGENFKIIMAVPPVSREKGRRALYCNTLVRLAKIFASNGYPQFLAALAREKDYGILRWPEMMKEIRQRSDLGHAEEALALAETLCAELEEAGNPDRDAVSLQAHAWGLRGHLLYARESYDDAQIAWARAFVYCKKLGDAKGMATYRDNLTYIEAAKAEPQRVDLEIEILETFTKARRLTDLHRFQASNALLSRLLEEQCKGAEIVATIKPHILNDMAFNHHRMGQKKEARKLAGAARDLCQERNDGVGGEIYTENLAHLGPPESTLGRIASSVIRPFRKGR